MTECSFHPGVETGVRCAECDRPICPKDFVPTPVGYKCVQCARPLPGTRRALKPRQAALAIIAGAAVGIGGALALRTVGFTSLLPSGLLGLLTAEAARRGSGGHRGTAVGAIAGLSALAGTVASGFGIISTAVATAAAVLYVTSNRW